MVHAYISLSPVMSRFCDKYDAVEIIRRALRVHVVGFAVDEESSPVKNYHYFSLQQRTKVSINTTSKMCHLS